MVEMVLKAVAQPAGLLGEIVGRSPAAQKLLLLAGVGAAYAGGVGFVLMLSRGLAAL